MADAKKPSGNAQRLTPHMGVVELAARLKRKHGGTVKGYNFDATDQTARQQNQDKHGPSLANELANDPTFPTLYTFAGYLGGVVDQKGPADATWQLLYLDAKLLTWLLLDVDSVVYTNTVTDDTSPFGSRDYVWLESDASVSQGEGPIQRNEVQARFLRGDFVSTGDFAASMMAMAGTFAPTTGPACPLTPGCCGIRTR
jgi:hypothetical protein